MILNRSSVTFRNTATVPSTGSCKRSEVASELIEQKLLSHNSGDSLIPTVYDAGDAAARVALIPQHAAKRSGKLNARSVRPANRLPHGSLIVIPQIHLQRFHLRLIETRAQRAMAATSVMIDRLTRGIAN